LSRSLPIDAIDAAFTAIARRDVVAVDVDREIVLCDDSRGVLHRLDPTASTLWPYLDGTGTLGEIAAAIADVSQVDGDRALADVLVAARALAEHGLLDGVGEPPELDNVDRFGEGARGPFVAESPSCTDSCFTLGDAGVLTVKAGPDLQGLRVSTPELAAAARAVLLPGLVVGVAALPNVSIKETTARAGRSLFYCYRSGRLITRARSPRRAIEAAVALLSSYGEAPGGCCRVRASIVVRDDVAALLSPECLWVADGLQPRLRAAGWRLADSRTADLDQETGQVVIPSPLVAIDRAALAVMASEKSDGQPPAPGRYPVRAWVAVAGDEPSAETAAARVVSLASGSDGLRAGSGRAVLQTARTVLREAVWAVSPTLDPATIIRTLNAAVL
jgi:Coenzyme PQQ synthesis protein D (PqqD)